MHDTVTDTALHAGWPLISFSHVGIQHVILQYGAAQLSFVAMKVVSMLLLHWILFRFVNKFVVACIMVQMLLERETRYVAKCKMSAAETPHFLPRTAVFPLLTMQRNNTVWLSGPNCTGDELHILRCQWANSPCTSCSQTENVVIHCSKCV